jgi:hypothetical protein
MRFLLLAAVSVVAFLPLPSPAGTVTDPKGVQTYKWTDPDGSIHYGDRVPVEDSARERSVLNRQGIPVREVDAQKSGAELEEALRLEAEAERQRQHDQFLLATYASAKDIEQLRDLRLSQVEGQIKAGWLYVDSLEGRLRVLQTRALAFKPYSERPDAKKMPDDLAEDLVHTLHEAGTQRRSLENKQAEAEKMRDQFEADIARYRSISIKVARASTP